MKVRNIIFDVIFVGNVSLSEKYVMLDVFTVFIETFCRSMPQEHVFQHLHESSLRLLPTDSCQIDVLLCSRGSNERANVHSTHSALISES